MDITDLNLFWIGLDWIGLDGRMDGWMDGWRKPNHMCSHFDELQTTGTVDLRRLAGNLNSVAK